MFREYVIMEGMTRDCQPMSVFEVPVKNGDYWAAYSKAKSCLKMSGEFLLDWRIETRKEDF